jgi:hypothetical protein
VEVWAVKVILNLQKSKPKLKVRTQLLIISAKVKKSIYSKNQVATVLSPVNIRKRQIIIIINVKRNMWIAKTKILCRTKV